jgi:hypothetical protein
VLTVAHLNHDPQDCRDENLKAFCQRCHLRYDAWFGRAFRLVMQAYRRECAARRRAARQTHAPA